MNVSFRAEGSARRELGDGTVVLALLSIRILYNLLRY